MIWLNILGLFIGGTLVGEALNGKHLSEGQRTFLVMSGLIIGGINFVVVAHKLGLM